MELTVDELLNSSYFTSVQQSLLYLDRDTSHSCLWSPLITWALKGLVRGRIWLWKAQLPPADSRNGIASKHMVHDSKQFFSSEIQSEASHEGRHSDLIFSCKIWCAQRKRVFSCSLLSNAASCIINVPLLNWNGNYCLVIWPLICWFQCGACWNSHTTHLGEGKWSNR